MYREEFVILYPHRRQQNPKIDGMENESGTGRDESTDIPLRPPDNQIPNAPAAGHLYNHQQLPFGHQNFPQPQFAHHPPHPQPSTFQHGMYPTPYPTTGPLHAAYTAFPFQPLQPTSFPVGGSFYPPPPYAYGHPSHLPPQQPVDPRFAIGATASHEQATFSPSLASFAEQPYHPRGVFHQHPYYTHIRPPVQANVRVGI